MRNDPLLSSSTKRSQYLSLEAANDRDAIAGFFTERFMERFVRPMEAPPSKGKATHKHGFAIMAISCLLIETLESFWQGWPTNQEHKSACISEIFFTGAEFSRATKPRPKVLQEHTMRHLTSGRNNRRMDHPTARQTV